MWGVKENEVLLVSGHQQGVPEVGCLEFPASKEFQQIRLT